RDLRRAAGNPRLEHGDVSGEREIERLLRGRARERSCRGDGPVARRSQSRNPRRRDRRPRTEPRYLPPNHLPHPLRETPAPPGVSRFWGRSRRPQRAAAEAGLGPAGGSPRTKPPEARTPRAAPETELWTPPPARRGLA